MGPPVHIQELLAPFEEATKKVSSSTTCSLSFASFALERLEGFLKKHIKKDHFKELGIEAMLEKLLKYKGEIDSQSLLPSFLDPRYSDRMTGNSRASVINLLKSMLQHTKGDRTQPKKQHSIFDMTEEENFAVAATVEYPELTRFINLQKINTDQDPLLWWSKHEAICPNLAEIARDQLAILASSVPSEVAFSAAGQVISDRRCNLNTITVQALMMHRAWKMFSAGAEYLKVEDRALEIVSQESDEE